MAFLKDNLYAEGNSEGSFVAPINPLANPANAEKLRIEKCGSCDIELAVDIATVGSTTTFTFGSPVTDWTDLTGVRCEATDGHGNFATMTEFPFAFDSTGWVGNEWTLSVWLRRGDETLDGLANCKCDATFTFGYNPAVGASINTLTANKSFTFSETVGGAAVTTIDYGTTPEIGTVQVNAYLKNAGNVTLKASNIDRTGNVLQAQITGVTETYGANVLYKDDERQLTIDIDTSAGIGVYSGDVTVTDQFGNTYKLTVQIEVV